jgi:hypothetical protein
MSGQGEAPLANERVIIMASIFAKVLQGTIAAVPARGYCEHCKEYTVNVKTGVCNSIGFHVWIAAAAANDSK